MYPMHHIQCTVTHIGSGASGHHGGKLVLEDQNFKTKWKSGLTGAGKGKQRISSHN